MTKKQVKGEFKTFVKGLITEASELNFPENASFAEENFELYKTGERKRRIGLKVDAYVQIGLPENEANTFFSQNNIDILEWRNVANIESFNCLVVFHPGGLRIVRQDSYQMLAEFSVNVLDAKIINNFLVCTTSNKDIALFSWENNQFVLKYKRITVRDIWGIQPYLDDKYFNYRPSPATFNTNLRYNLYNQSWGFPQTNISGVRQDPTEAFSQGWSSPPGPYPSDSEQVWSGMYFDSSTNPPQERWRLSKAIEKYGPNVATGRGYFIIDLLDRSVSRKQAVITNKAQFPEMQMGDFNPPIDKTDSGPTKLIEFAGRIFYSGFSDTGFIGDTRSPKLYNAVCFSQLLSGSSNITNCYQAGDPTNRLESDIVDTDGGILFISEAERIVGLSVFKNSLIVFATNGVWAISGGSDYGFSATNYKVIKITNVGCIKNSKAIISTNSGVFFWSIEGILLIAPNQFGDLTASNLTANTIQSLYNEIYGVYDVNKIKGCYDAVDKKVRWIYGGESIIDNSLSVKELNFDLELNSFSVNNFTVPSNNWPRVMGVFSTETSQESSREDWYAFKYYGFRLIAGFYSFFVASYGDTFYDWKDIDDVGIDNKAFILTGATTGNDSTVAKQIPYFVLHMRKTEEGVDFSGNPVNPSGCKARTQWGFTKSESSNKWSPLVSVYRYKHQYTEDDYSIVTTKNKMRGRGSAFSLYMESEPGKDCQIIGWNLTLNANQF